GIDAYHFDFLDPAAPAAGDEFRTGLDGLLDLEELLEHNHRTCRREVTRGKHSLLAKRDDAFRDPDSPRRVDRKANLSIPWGTRLPGPQHCLLGLFDLQALEADRLLLAKSCGHNRCRVCHFIAIERIKGMASGRNRRVRCAARRCYGVRAA